MNLKDAHFVRLNSELMPIKPLEASLYERYEIQVRAVEAAQPQEIIPHVCECEALAVVSAALPEPVIESLSNCRLISRLGNGTDKIDVAAATRRGIIVSNVPTFCNSEMADNVMAFLLALNRRIPRMNRHMLAGHYMKARVEGLALTRLSEMTLGLIGFGASAKAVVERAKPFGLKVLATRKNMSASRKEADALGVEIVDLDNLLARSAYVSLHLPLDSDSRHLLDRRTLEKMKPGACLINTSRGAIVDEDALAELLAQGHLGGAGLDTFEVIDIFGEKESPPDHPLTRLDNVILTPHVSGLSVQASREVSATGIQNLVSVLSGNMPHPHNIVNTGVVPRFPLREHDPDLFNT
jgi:D-3-phosphoglycerate dehydrogenase